MAMKLKQRILTKYYKEKARIDATQKRASVKKDKIKPLPLWRPWESGKKSRPLKVHNEETPVPPSEFVCEECPSTFKRESEKRRHLESVHHGQVQYCPVCRQKFTRRDNLTRHIKMKHASSGRPRCQYCDKKLSRKDSVARHLSSCSKHPKNEGRKRRWKVKVRPELSRISKREPESS